MSKPRHFKVTIELELIDKAGNTGHCSTLQLAEDIKKDYESREGFEKVTVRIKEKREYPHGSGKSYFRY